MKRIAFLILAGVTLFVLVLRWRATDTAQDDFYQPIEANLNEALQRLRDASPEERRANASLASGVLVLADALAQSDDVRRKQAAAAAKIAAGQILFVEPRPPDPASMRLTATDGSSATTDSNEQVIAYPGSPPLQLFTPLPLQAYVGTYAGTIVGRPVHFVVKVTGRNLLGIRIAGLDDQPTFEFAEFKPQEFIQPDVKAVVVFTHPTSEGFRTLVFQQNGMREQAENTRFAPSSGD